MKSKACYPCKIAICHINVPEMGKEDSGTAVYQLRTGFAEAVLTENPDNLTCSRNRKNKKSESTNTALLILASSNTTSKISSNISSNITSFGDHSRNIAGTWPLAQA